MAKPSEAIAKPIKGRTGANQERDEAAPLAPANKAKTGVMQTKDAGKWLQTIRHLQPF